jgi:ATP-binding cassette, subfamily B, bacterial PglK
VRVVVRRILAFIEPGHRAAWIALALLVVDEGTSALDAATEAALLDALASDGQDRSLIIVAQRLTIVRHCSGLLFVESGRVVDSGTFDELLDRNAEFRRMVQMAPASQGYPDA